MKEVCPRPARTGPCWRPSATGRRWPSRTTPRYWDEANLTNHAARPLIAAATGIDVPQPLAGDVALAPAAWTAALERWREFPLALTRCVDGYGVDAFLLQAAAAHGPVVSVPVREVNQHAASFPHLPAIFTEAVLVLLHPARTTTPHHIDLGIPRVADRPVGPDELTARLEKLTSLRPQPREPHSPTWPEAVAAAWSAVAATGTPAEQAATRLWLAYLDRVCDWLTDSAPTPAADRPGLLHSGARAVLTALTTTPPRRP